MRNLGTASPMRENVERAVAAIATGHPVVVVDEHEDGGDLVFAAEHATTELLAFVVRHTSGLVCVALTDEDCDRLELPPMYPRNENKLGAAYRVSVDLRGTGTGISAADRARTIAALASSVAAPGDFTRPGHVMPLAARDGGVLQRPGRAEAAVDLARLAGSRPAGGLCEVVSTERPCEMAGGAELTRFAAEHGLEIVTIADLATYRRRAEAQVRRLAAAALPTVHGHFRALGYRGVHDGAEHMVLISGDVQNGAGVPLYVHTECLTGDVLGSTACDCGNALERGLAAVSAEECGVVVYVRPAAGPHACGLSEVPPSGDSEWQATIVESILADLHIASVRPVDPAAVPVQSLEKVPVQSLEKRRAAGGCDAMQPVAPIAEKSSA